MRRILVSALLVAAAAAFVLLTTGASHSTPAGTYRIEFDDAFNLVVGGDLKVAGVPAGRISAVNLDQKTLRALVTVQVTRTGFGQFHSDATCESRPVSLIGEYYIDCNPGTSGRVLKPGSIIPVTHTQSSIAPDVVQDIMRMPYRQRLTVIINELGAAAAARGGDLQAALQRAVPALTETDALLNLLANDSHTLQALTRDSDSVVTALANNNANINRFIDAAARTAGATATQQANLRLSLARLPGLLEQLRPTLAQLGTTITTNEPVLRNLHTAAGQINRLFTDLPPFSRSARPAIAALGKASVTGRAAVTAATPTVRDLNAFAKPTPGLAQNLAIVLRSIDTQSNAVERDPRSPGGKGFSGLQALLGYVFNQTLAINAYGQFGHMLSVDAFFSPMCSPYATPATVASSLQKYGSAYRSCYSWLGPNQPGVNETDPSNPGAQPPDPGGAPPGQRGPSLMDSVRMPAPRSRTRRRSQTTSAAPGASSTTSSTSTTSTTSSAPAGPAVPVPPVAPSTSSRPSTTTSSSQAQQLLNYLLAP